MRFPFLAYVSIHSSRSWFTHEVTIFLHLPKSQCSSTLVNYRLRQPKYGLLPSVNTDEYKDSIKAVLENTGTASCSS